MRKHLEAAGPDQLREMVKMMAEGLMDAEAQSLCGAEYGLPGPDRVNQRNGYRLRRWDTRAGSIELAVPKLRQGSYYPDWLLDARKRSERALMGVVAECYLKGISTRKVDAVVKQMGIEGISKSQVSELAASLDKQVDDFRNRPLESEGYLSLIKSPSVVKSRRISAMRPGLSLGDVAPAIGGCRSSPVGHEEPWRSHHREPRTAPAARHLETQDATSSPKQDRSCLLGLAAAVVASLARCGDHCQTRHRDRMAPQGLQTVLDLEESAHPRAAQS